MSNALLQRRPRSAASPSDAFTIPSKHSRGASSSPQSPRNENGGTVSTSTRRKGRRRRGRRFTPCLGTRGGIVMFLGVLLLFCFVLLRFGTKQDHFVGFLSSPLPRPNIEIMVPNTTELPLIHIVNTRFMQEQGKLGILAEARLSLFFTFCFPTMVSQSTQDFFWIIKTDPKFPSSPLFSKLLERIHEHPNIYLVSSNTNYLISPNLPGSWRDGSEPRDLLASPIHSGNRTRLLQAIALREERPVLETRLDADDGLHRYYLQYMQFVARKRFLVNPAPPDSASATSPPPPRWLYWCTRRHLEWHSSLKQQQSKQQTRNLSMHGFLTPVQHSHLCVTPGLTIGYNVGTREVPLHSHDVLYKQLEYSTDCYNEPSSSWLRRAQPEPSYNVTSPCLELVEDFLFCALRSRTWTSAGMLRVGANPQQLPTDEIAGKLWQVLDERFAIAQDQAEATLDFLWKHRREIAYENLMGQCTSGHSCKQQAKAELEAWMKEH